jgi:hypothetical protein
MKDFLLLHIETIWIKQPLIAIVTDLRDKVYLHKMYKDIFA